MTNQDALKAPRRLAVASSPLWDLSLSEALESLAPAAKAEAQSQAPPSDLSYPRIHAEIGRYRLRMAETDADRETACKLRFKVFNIELGKGLVASYETGLDTDRFDALCEHLLVEDRVTQTIVGTYRMQSGITAALNLGYYSEQEFDFVPYEAIRPETLELGRASIDREHRTPEVLTLLWRGIAQYATDMQLRYLIGCSSLNSIDSNDAWQMYDKLQSYLISEELRTNPKPSFICPRHSRQSLEMHEKEEVKVPKLLRTYLTIGARICSTPAFDGEFGTIDFLTLLDLRSISSSARNRFFAPLAR